MVGCAGHILLFCNRFLLSWVVSYDRLRCGVVSVCRLLLGEFLLVLSGTGMTSFCGCTLNLMLLYVILAFWLFTRSLLQSLRLN